MNKQWSATRLLALSLTVLLVAESPTHARSQSELSDVLDRARMAAGWTSDFSNKDLRMEGAVTFLEVEETFVADYADDGRYRVTFEGQLNRDVRYDGQSVRGSEFSALWHELEFSDRESELLREWVHSGYWLDSRAPLNLGMSRLPVGEGLIGLDIQLRDGKLEARVELSSEDYLVRTLAISTGEEDLLTRFSYHEPVDGLWIAREMHSNLGMGSLFTRRVREAKFVPHDAATFALKPDVLDFRFDSGVSPEIEVTKSESKHLFIRALVNGKDLGLFLFDTGAGFSGLSMEAAETLGLKSFGETALTGLGGGLTASKFFRAETLQLGPLIIDNLVFSETGTNRKSKMVGEKVAGVLGWDILRRAIVDLEPRGKMRLYDPADYELSTGEWSPISLHYKVPFSRGRFDGDREGLFMLDCGAAGSTVMFFYEPAKELGFLDDEGATEVTSRGAGGAYSHKMDHLDWFETAGDRITDIPVLVLTQPAGESDPYSLGLIGGGLLRNYRLIFDYARKRVAISYVLGGQ